MIEIIILTHGNLANEIKNTLKLFASTENVKTFTLNPDSSLDDFRNEIENCLFQNSKDALVLVDLFGGTPFNTVVKLCNEKNINNKNIEIVTGVNLPMVLEITTNTQGKSLEEVKKTAINAGKNGIRDFYSEINKKGGI